MIKKLLLLVSIALFSLTITAQNGNFKIESNTVILDENGLKISADKLISRINNEHLELAINKDAQGHTKQIRIKKRNNKTMGPATNNRVKVGQKAPNFKVIDINGNKIDSNKLRGKVIVLNFWFTSCMPCISEIPALNRVYERYQNNSNVVFVAITFNRTKLVKRFLSHTPMKYTVVPFENPTCTKFGVSGFPTNMIIDKVGNYQWISLGGHSAIDKEIDAQIKKALEKNK